MKRKFLFAFILAFGGAELCFAKEPLTLKDFFHFAEEQDPEYKKIISENERVKFHVALGLPTPQVSLSVEGEHGFNLSDGGDSSVLTGEISKEILSTGTTLSATHTKTERPDRAENVTELRLEQSLFRNFLGQDTRLQKDALTDEAEAIRLSVLEDYETYLYNKAVDFLDYHRAYLDVQLAEKIVEEAATLRKNVRQKRQASIATQTDLDRSELQFLLKQEDHLEKKKILGQKWQSLRKVTDQGESPPVTVSQLEVDKSSAWQEVVLEQLRPSQIASLDESASHRRQVYVRRLLYPNLSLLGGYNIDNSQRFSTTVDRQEAVLGLRLEIPLFDGKGQASRQEALLVAQQSQLNKRLVSLGLIKDLASAKLELREAGDRVNLSQRKVELIERILKDEERRYRIGRIDLDQLIETKNSYAEYRFQHQSDQVDLQKGWLAWLALIDQLIPFRQKL